MALEERDAVFGYIKPVKAELKVKEWEAYQGIYCGLCKHCLLYTSPSPRD